MLEGVNQQRISIAHGRWKTLDFKVLLVCIYRSKSVDNTIIKLITRVTAEIITLVPPALVY